MIEGILIGLTTALTFQNIFMVMIGCFFGTIIGMLPGLGPMTAIALMIPITYGFDPATGLILMAGVQLNRIPDYGSGGCRFESCRGHYFKPLSYC